MEDTTEKRGSRLALLVVLIALAAGSATVGQQVQQPATPTELARAAAVLIGNADLSRYGLTGLKTVRVVASSLSPALNGTGVTAEGLKQRVESLLRERGPLSVDENAEPYFYVGLPGVGEMADGNLVYNVELILFQPAMLLRAHTDPATGKTRTVLVPAAVTWRGVCLTVSRREAVRAEVEATLAEHLKVFARDCAMENPGAKWEGKNPQSAPSERGWGRR